MAAFTIISKTHPTQASLKSLYDFLSDFKNFKLILPEDKISDFQYTGDQCSFNIQGITPMTVRLVEKEEARYILFSSEGLAKFNFNLKAIFTGEPGLPGSCSVELMADLNPFIRSMAEKPLTTLVNTMALKLSQLKPEAL